MQATADQKQTRFIAHTPEVNAHMIRVMMGRCNIKGHQIEQLPQAFHQFMKMRGLDIKQLTIPIPRYIRTKPTLTLTTEQIAKDIGIPLDQIVQIEQHFWSLNPEAKINRSALYENSMLYGMDYSSAIPTRCLELCSGLRVLELCSAPGNKAMLMADSHSQITITGVEISHNRANIMRSLVRKYKLEDKVEVVEADGLQFTGQPFDRVLVDAECTHEGSLKHLFKFFHQATGAQGKKEQKLSKQQRKQFEKNNSNPYTTQITKANEWSPEDFQERFLDEFKLSNLNFLQSGLLSNGFSLLKPGGILVYSTCSFDEAQNESIIAQFLDAHPEAELMDAGEKLDCAVAWKEGTLKGTLRFSPSVSCCGGMFISKLRRRAKSEAL